MTKRSRASVGVFGIAVCFLAVSAACSAHPNKEVTPYDLVILNGRVIDPESNTDRILNVAIGDGTIQGLSEGPLSGHQVIDARGLVVSPGFIDTDTYAHLARWSVRDGVTSALDLRSGAADVDAWYREHADRMLINLGVGVGYAHIREAVLGVAGKLDQERLQPASASERADIVRRIRGGLDAGALAIGLGGAQRWSLPSSELRDALVVSAEYKAHLVATIRDVIWKATDVPSILADIIDAARATRAAVHIPHLSSSGGPHVPRLLAMIEEARSRGLAITAEDLPYRESTFQVGALGPVEMQFSDAELHEIEVLATGERLNRQNVATYVATKPDAMAHNSWIEPFVLQSLTSPIVSIASHGSLDTMGRGHPRTAGTFSRVLGRYVREQHALSLNEAIRKMTLMPAQRLEARVPAMRNKGRIRTGADADIVIFDPGRIIERATFKEPTLAPDGIAWVLVNGVVVVHDGTTMDVFPGRPIRAPRSTPMVSRDNGQ